MYISYSLWIDENIRIYLIFLYKDKTILKFMLVCYSNYSVKLKDELSKINKYNLIQKYADDKKFMMILSILYNELENSSGPIDDQNFAHLIGGDLWNYLWEFVGIKISIIDPDTAFLVKQLFYEPLKYRYYKKNIEELDELITARLSSNKKAIAFSLSRSIVKIYSEYNIVDLGIYKHGFMMGNDGHHIDTQTLMVSPSTRPSKHNNYKYLDCYGREISKYEIGAIKYLDGLDVFDGYKI